MLTWGGDTLPSQRVPKRSFKILPAYAPVYTSQVQNSLKVTEESEPKKCSSEAESDQATVAHTESVKCEAELVTVGDNVTESSSVIQAPPSVSLTTSDIQDVRQNLLSASQEAQQLLRDLQNIDSSE